MKTIKSSITLLVLCLIPYCNIIAEDKTPQSTTGTTILVQKEKDANELIRNAFLNYEYASRVKKQIH